MAGARTTAGDVHVEDAAGPLRWCAVSRAQRALDDLIRFVASPQGAIVPDLARRLPIPIFHVNSEDPDAVSRVGRLAAEYRYAFGTPVVVDLIGYRRHGHSEVDDPKITQPLRYRKFDAHPPL